MRIEELIETEMDITESRVLRTIRSMSKDVAKGGRHSSIILQSHFDKAFYTVLVTDGKQHFTFDLDNGKPTTPKKIPSSTANKIYNDKTSQMWREINSKTFFQQHWFRLMSAFITGGTMAVFIGPLAAFMPIFMGVLSTFIGEVRTALSTPLATGASASVGAANIDIQGV